MGGLIRRTQEEKMEIIHLGGTLEPADQQDTGRV
jgi:hypothetical protein